MTSEWCDGCCRGKGQGPGEEDRDIHGTGQAEDMINQLLGVPPPPFSHVPFLSLNALRCLPLPHHFLKRAWPWCFCATPFTPKGVIKKISLSHPQ